MQILPYRDRTSQRCGLLLHTSDVLWFVCNWQNGWTDRDAVGGTLVLAKEAKCQMGMHIGTTWWIRTNDHCAASMRLCHINLPSYRVRHKNKRNQPWANCVYRWVRIWEMQLGKLFLLINSRPLHEMYFKRPVSFVLSDRSGGFHHCIKCPSIMLSWHNTVLLSVRLP